MPQINIKTISNGFILKLEDGTETYEQLLEDILELAAINLLDPKVVCKEETAAKLKMREEQKMCNEQKDYNLGTDCICHYCNKKIKKNAVLTTFNTSDPYEELKAAHRTCIKGIKGLYWMDDSGQWHKNRGKRLDV